MFTTSGEGVEELLKSSRLFDALVVLEGPVKNFYELGEAIVLIIADGLSDRLDLLPGNT